MSKRGRSEIVCAGTRLVANSDRRPVVLKVSYRLQEMNKRMCPQQRTAILLLYFLFSTNSFTPPSVTRPSYQSPVAHGVINDYC